MKGRRYAEQLVAPILLGFMVASTQLRAAQDRLAVDSLRAKQAMDSGRFEEAAAIYTRLVRELPDNPGLRLDLGLALHSEGKYREATEQFRWVVRQQPQFSAAWFMLGLAYLKLDHPETAVAPLEHAVHLDPHNRRAQLELADALRLVGNLPEACEAFKRLTDLDPGSAKAWQGLGLSYAARARSTFTTLERTSPDSAYRDALLGLSLQNQQQYRSAFYWYRQALAREPGIPGIHAALAEIYRQAGHADWAAIEEDRERRLPRPDCGRERLRCAFADGRFAEVLSTTRQRRDAESYYWQAKTYQELSRRAFNHLTQMPPSAEVHELVAEADADRSDYDAAVQEWQEALKLNARDMTAQEGLARSLWMAGDYQQARPILERLLREKPESAKLNFVLGDTLLGLRSAANAVPFLERAVKLDPTLAPARASLGRAYLHSGRPRDAIPELRAALSANENNSSLYELAQAYKQTGQTAAAKATMQRLERVSASTLARTQKAAQEHAILPP